MQKKVYFAGSIRGGRADAALYNRIIAYINRTDCVLTEHVGMTELSLTMQEEKAEQWIYDRDMAWLRGCDLLIAECSCPSLGVGYELAYAEKCGKPCYIFFNRQKTELSAMLTGNPYFRIFPYTEEEEIYPVLDKILKEMKIVRNIMKTAQPLHDPEMGMAASERTAAFHQTVPGYHPTALVSWKEYAKRHGIGGLYIKDEGTRFGLKAFKGLGGIYAVFRAVCERTGLDPETAVFDDLVNEDVRVRIRQTEFITTTDGNHGKGVSWAAGLLGCRSHVYMPKGTVPVRAQAIRDAGGAETIITDMDYDTCVRYTAELARKNDWCLVQDTSWPGYETIPRRIMQGYLTMAKEALDEMEAQGVRPTHVFLQAGVGSMAGAVTAYLADRYPEALPVIITVEADNTACVYESVKKGTGETVAKNEGGTIMAGLNCGEVCTEAWRYLKANVSYALSMEDAPAEEGMRQLAHPEGDDIAVVAGESGASGFSALHALLTNPSLAEERAALGLDGQAVVLIINTEADTDPENYKRITGCDK